MIPLLLAWATTAQAWSVEEVQTRLSEVAGHRRLRLQREAPAVSEPELRKVVAGAVVTGTRDATMGSKAYGAAILSVGLPTLWAALNDETRHPGYTAVAYSELLEGRVCHSGRRVLQYLPVPFITDRWWIGVLTANAGVRSASGGSVRELAFDSLTDPALVKSPGGREMIQSAQPIGFSRGAWFLVALDERSTYVEYYVHTDPGGKIPGSMASRFASRGVRENIEAIQRFAKEVRPSCPIE